MRGCLLALAVCGAAACSAAAPHSPHVVLIVIDTLRADHLSLYGYPKATSPQIDAIAADSLVFDSAFSVMSHTLPSMLSLMTGLHPETHRVFSNGRRFRGTQPTLAERLSAAGYDTAGFVSGSPLISRSGMARGFDVYRDTYRRKRGTVATRVSGETTNRRVFQWLSQRGDGPFFLFVHYFDVHRPYQSGPGGTGPLRADGVLKRWMSRLGTEGVAVGDVSSRAILLDGRSLELEEAVNAYDNQIHRVDALVGQLWQELERLGHADQTLLLIAADHGEGLGQHGYYSHGLHLYDEQLRVPLIVRAPRQHASRFDWSPRRVPEVVSLLDVLPSVLEVLGLDPQPGLPGRSLVAPARGPRRLLASRRRFPAHVQRKRGSDFSAQVPLHALREGRAWKYLRSGDGKQELYDLATDPGERRNLAPDSGVELEEFSRHLDALLQLRRSDAPEAPLQIDTEERKALEALGYLQ